MWTDPSDTHCPGIRAEPGDAAGPDRWRASREYRLAKMWASWTVEHPGRSCSGEAAFCVVRDSSETRPGKFYTWCDHPAGTCMCVCVWESMCVCVWERATRDRWSKGGAACSFNPSVSRTKLPSVFVTMPRRLLPPQLILTWCLCINQREKCNEIMNQTHVWCW